MPRKPVFSAAYIFIERNEDGVPTHVLPHRSNCSTYLAVGNRLALAMFKEDQGRKALKKLEKLLAESYELRPGATAENFIAEIHERFPLVFPDKSIKNEDLPGYHPRREFDETFDPYDQAIVLNGNRTHDLCVAGMAAEASKDKDSPEQQRYRTSIFINATTVYHELGHMYTTYVGLGKKSTPPTADSSAKTNKASKTVGEAGAFLEEETFGGVMTVLRDKNEDDGQAGICYLRKPDGSVRRINQTLIDRFVGYKFELPFQDLGEAPPADAETLGQGKPKHNYPKGDPLAQAETKRLLEEHLSKPNSNPFKWTKEIRNLIANNPNPRTFNSYQESVLMEVAFNPGLRLTEEPKAQAVK